MHFIWAGGFAADFMRFPHLHPLFTSPAPEVQPKAFWWPEPPTRPILPMDPKGVVRAPGGLGWISHRELLAGALVWGLQKEQVSPVTVSQDARYGTGPKGASRP